MSGWMGYALGYENGRSDAERSREQRELIQRVMYGHRTVEVDQSYIDNLRQALHSASVTSDHNYDTADQFHREALEWKAEALHYKAGAAALQARVTALEAQLAERNTKLEQTQALYEWAHAKYHTAFHEKSDLDLFRLMSTWLLAAHAAAAIEAEHKLIQVTGQVCGVPPLPAGCPAASVWQGTLFDARLAEVLRGPRLALMRPAGYGGHGYTHSSPTPGNPARHR